MTATGSSMSARTGATAVYCGGRIVIFGGASGSNLRLGLNDTVVLWTDNRLQLIDQSYTESGLDSPNFECVSNLFVPCASLGFAMRQSDSKQAEFYLLPGSVHSGITELSAAGLLAVSFCLRSAAFLTHTPSTSDVSSLATIECGGMLCLMANTASATPIYLEGIALLNGAEALHPNQRKAWNAVFPNTPFPGGGSIYFQETVFWMDSSVIRNSR